jgi:hypothetical protein
MSGPSPDMTVGTNRTRRALRSRLSRLWERRLSGRRGEAVVGSLGECLENWAGVVDDIMHPPDPRARACSTRTSLPPH